jgi:hypothetical protein
VVGGRLIWLLNWARCGELACCQHGDSAGAGSNKGLPLVDVVRDAHTDIGKGARRAMCRLALLVLGRGLPYLGSKRSQWNEADQNGDSVG